MFFYTNITNCNIKCILLYFLLISDNSKVYTDKLYGIENITGTQNNDTLYGNNLNNTLLGAEGNDTLKGGLGVDRLNGGEGNDLFLIQDFDLILLVY